MGEFPVGSAFPIPSLCYGMGDGFPPLPRAKLDREFRASRGMCKDGRPQVWSREIVAGLLPSVRTPK